MRRVGNAAALCGNCQIQFPRCKYEYGILHLQWKEGVEIKHTLRKESGLGHQEAKNNARIAPHDPPRAPTPEEKTQQRAPGTKDREQDLLASPQGSLDAWPEHPECEHGKRQMGQIGVEQWRGKKLKEPQMAYHANIGQSQHGQGL